MGWERRNATRENMIQMVRRSHADVSCLPTDETTSGGEGPAARKGSRGPERMENGGVELLAGNVESGARARACR